MQRLLKLQKKLQLSKKRFEVIQTDSYFPRQNIQKQIQSDKKTF